MFLGKQCVIALRDTTPIIRNNDTIFAMVVQFDINFGCSSIQTIFQQLFYRSANVCDYLTAADLMNRLACKGFDHGGKEYVVLNFSEKTLNRLFRGLESSVLHGCVVRVRSLVLTMYT